jgi:hypothetical protein
MVRLFLMLKVFNHKCTTFQTRFEFSLVIFRVMIPHISVSHCRWSCLPLNTSDPWLLTTLHDVITLKSTITVIRLTIQNSSILTLFHPFHNQPCSYQVKINLHAHYKKDTLVWQCLNSCHLLAAVL